MIKKIVKIIFKKNNSCVIFKHKRFPITISCFFYAIPLLGIDLSPNCINYTKNLMIHFLMQKTLANATKVIKFMHNKYGLNDVDFNVLQYHTMLSNPLIINCVYSIESTHSLEPVFFLWDSMGLLIPYFFLYEYAFLIFLIYKDILFYFAFSPHVSFKWNYILVGLISNINQLYNQIEQLPLHEIIIIINLLSEELPIICQQYFDEPTNGWYDWLKKNWLKFSVTLCTLLIKVISIFKNSNAGEAIHIHHIKPNYHASPIVVAPADILKITSKQKKVA